MTPNRPQLRAVDPEAPAAEAPARSMRNFGATAWLVAALAVLAIAGWWLFVLEAGELRRAEAALARSDSRVFSLEARMQQVRRSASALAASLAAGELQARALEALAAPEAEAASKAASRSAPLRG